MNQELKETDFYKTIDGKYSSKIKVKGSKFIASAAHVSTKEDAQFFIDKVSSEYYDATHNCFAYRIGYDGMEYRAGDDGEPSGSAGKPILFAIKKFELSDVIVVVTRYFGGTKLGVGGLARTYSEAAETVLDKCGIKKVYRTLPVNVYCTYEDISPVKKLVDDYSVKFTDHYADAIEIVAEIPLSKIEEFTSKITSATSGRAGTVIKKN